MTGRSCFISKMQLFVFTLLISSMVLAVDTNTEAEGRFSTNPKI